MECTADDVNDELANEILKMTIENPFKNLKPAAAGGAVPDAGIGPMPELEPLSEEAEQERARHLEQLKAARAHIEELEKKAQSMSVIPKTPQEWQMAYEMRWPGMFQRICHDTIALRDVPEINVHNKTVVNWRRLFEWTEANESQWFQKNSLVKCVMNMQTAHGSVGSNSSTTSPDKYDRLVLPVGVNGKFAVTIVAFRPKNASSSSSSSISSKDSDDNMDIESTTDASESISALNLRCKVYYLPVCVLEVITSEDTSNNSNLSPLWIMDKRHEFRRVCLTTLERGNGESYYSRFPPPAHAATSDADVDMDCNSSSSSSGAAKKKQRQKKGKKNNGNRRKVHRTSAASRGGGGASTTEEEEDDEWLSSGNTKKSAASAAAAAAMHVMKANRSNVNDNGCTMAVVEEQTDGPCVLSVYNVTMSLGLHDLLQGYELLPREKGHTAKPRCMAAGWGSFVLLGYNDRWSPDQGDPDPTRAYGGLYVVHLANGGWRTSVLVPPLTVQNQNQQVTKTLDDCRYIHSISVVYSHRGELLVMAGVDNAQGETLFLNLGTPMTGSQEYENVTILRSERIQHVEQWLVHGNQGAETSVVADPSSSEQQQQQGRYVWSISMWPTHQEVESRGKELALLPGVQEELDQMAIDAEQAQANNNNKKKSNPINFAKYSREAQEAYMHLRCENPREPHNFLRHIDGSHSPLGDYIFVSASTHNCKLSRYCADQRFSRDWFIPNIGTLVDADVYSNSLVVAHASNNSVLIGSVHDGRFAREIASTAIGAHLYPAKFSYNSVHVSLTRGVVLLSTGDVLFIIPGKQRRPNRHI